MTGQPKVKIYTNDGTVAGERELNAAVFGVEVKPTLVHQVLTILRGNARQPWAHTKTKGDVRGGGKKPWKQKGTGRARQGSTRSPQWVGGGVTFGPRSDRDYSRKINSKVKKLAVCMSFSDKVANDRMVLIDALTLKNGKTREATTIFGKLPIKGKIMIITPKSDAMLLRGVKNLKNVFLTNAASVALPDLIKADYVLMTGDAVAQIEHTFGTKKS